MQKQLMHVHKTIHAEHYLSPVHAYDRHSMGSKQYILYAIWYTLLIWLHIHCSVCFLQVAELLNDK